jgi:predicted anti-sigma-YlaC factor YlaD
MEHTRQCVDWRVLLAIALLFRALPPTHAAAASTWVVVVAFFAAGIACLMSCTVLLETAGPAGDHAAPARSCLRNFGITREITKRS